MIVCAGRGEHISCAVPIGVGLVEAAMGLSKLCLHNSIDEIIFVGSAGAYSYDVELFSLYESVEATQIEGAFLYSWCYTPLDNHIRCEKNMPNGEKNLAQNVSYETFKSVVVNSSNYITTNWAIAQKMAGAGILLENMEFFAVLRVAQEFGIRARGVFCVSNYCDENAHVDFMKNRARAVEILEKFIEEYL